MPERELHRTLEELQRGLAAEESLDEALRAELRETMEEIARRLDADAPDIDLPLVERIRELMLRYEGEHPQAAEAVGRVVRALSRLGI